MTDIILTATTCGFNCWMALEDVCRCSCGGVNHACLRDGGKQPERTSKIKGKVYQLVAVGSYIAMDRAVRKFEQALIDAGQYKDVDYGHIKYRYPPDDAAIRKAASQSQIERWPELAAARECESYAIEQFRHILWVRRDLLAYVDAEAVLQSEDEGLGRVRELVS